MTNDPKLVRQTHVWWLRLTEPSPRAASAISTAEMEKAERFIHPDDRMRYIAAHHALRQILSEYIKKAPEELAFTTNEHGKPRLIDSTAIGFNLEFNLSHSGNIALVAVSTHGRVGVDVEQLRSAPVTKGVAERFFSPPEVMKLRSLPAQDQVPAFFRCWTLKEAYLKALGCGISDADLAEAEVSILEHEKPDILRTVSRDGTSRWTVRQFSPLPGYLAAVVVEGNQNITILEWNKNFSPR
jgi:4'-phosphopantetheinyl transferase